MASENTEPIPVPPPIDAPTEPATAATAAAPTTTEAAEAPVPQPETTPAPAAPAPTAPAAAEPTPAEPAPPAPEPEVTPAPVEAVSEVKVEETKATDPTPAATAAEPTPEAAPAPAPAAAEEKKKEEEVEEPQNALTRKFTEAEWKAVKELRAQLPSIFAKAYPDRSPAPESITLWGVPLSRAPSARASVILAKFARARNLSAADAAEMLVATLRWRDEFKIDEIMGETFDAETFGKLGKVFGKDKEGHPVTYNLYGAVTDMKAVFGDVQRFIRWRVQFMEESIKLLDFETVDQMVQIHDYEGVSMMSRDASQKAAAKEATSIFQNHYPEFLYRKFFVNVPMLLTWIYWLFKPLVSAATLAKMSVVGSGAKTIGAELSQVIPLAELPKRYGGQAVPEDF